MSHIKTNDKISIQNGQKNIIFIHIQEAMNDFNEENINSLIENILSMITYDQIQKDEYYKLWRTQHSLLKQDYAFSIDTDPKMPKEEYIVFKLTDASVHRKNEKLMQLLTKYIKYNINVQKQLISVMPAPDSTMAPPKIPKRRKAKEFKRLEQSCGITEDNVHSAMTIEENLDNILVMIANNRTDKEVKID